MYKLRTVPNKRITKQVNTYCQTLELFRYAVRSSGPCGNIVGMLYMHGRESDCTG